MSIQADRLSRILDALGGAIVRCDHDEAQRLIDLAYCSGATRDRVVNAVEFSHFTSQGGCMDLDLLRIEPPSI